MSASEKTTPANDARERHDDHGALRRWLQAGAVAAGVGTAALFAPGVPIALADDTSTTADAPDADTPDAPSDTGATLSTASDSNPPSGRRAQRPVSTFSAQGVVTTITPRARLRDIGNLTSQIRTALTRDVTDTGLDTPSRPRQAVPDVILSRPVHSGDSARSESAPAQTVEPRKFDAVSLTTPPAVRVPAPLKAVVSQKEAVTGLLERKPTSGRVTTAAAVNDANLAAPSTAAKPYPPAVTAPVTVRAIVTDVLSWTRPGTPAPDVPLPTTPLNDLIAGAWIAVRRAHYTFFNSAPTATPTVVRRNTDTGEVNGSLGAQDADGDVLTYGIVTDAKNGTVELHDDGTYTYTPSRDLAHSGGVDSVTFSIDDATANPWHVHGLRGLFAPERPTTVTVEIVVPKITNQAPVAPTAVDGPKPDDDGTVTGTIDATDANKDPLTYEVTTKPTKGTVTLTGNTYTYTPTADARHAAAADNAKPEDKTDTFDITTSDGYGGTVVTTVTVDIKSKNSAPTVTDVVVQSTDSTFQRVFFSGANNSTVSVSRGDVVLKPLDLRDDDSDQVTVTATIKNPQWGEVTTEQDGTIKYTPTAKTLQYIADEPLGTRLTEVVTLTFDDGHGGITTKDVTVDVTGYAQKTLLLSAELKVQQIDVSGLSDANPELTVSDLPGFIDELPLQDSTIFKRGDRVYFKTKDGTEYDLGPASSFNSVAIAKAPDSDEIVVTTYLNSRLQTFLFVGKKTTDSP